MENPDDMQKSRIKEAVCVQADFWADNAYSQGYSSVRIGDFSMTRAVNGTDKGSGICMQSLDILDNSGLLYRGI